VGDLSATAGGDSNLSTDLELLAICSLLRADHGSVTDIAQIVRSLGGMAQKRQLVRRGARDLDLTRAVRSGEVHRVRNGWYSTMDETSAEVRAVRVGGRLTGISAIEARGGWVLGRHPLHVSVHDNAARLRTQQNRHKRLDVKSTRGVVLHWDARELRERGTAVAVPLIDALERVILDEPLETAVAALDWALHTGAIDRIDFETIILRLPEERRGIADWVDPNCESLPESVSRTRLRLAGHTVRSQIAMGDGRSIDLLVDEFVAVEVDGDEYHRHTFEYDRRKDVDITLMGFHGMRPSARMVFNDWPRFERAVEAALSARGHSGNSGNALRSPLATRGMRGWKRRPARRTPEFPKAGARVRG
jgi:very-short-patch-repair endonuclease